jgi:DNA polymerase-3 subunit epsilon
VTNDATDNLSQMARALESSGNYRVLRRLVARDVITPTSADEPIKVGVLLDLETTGLDAKTDEVIELGMVKFAYCLDGRIAHVIDCFGSLNEPANPIPAEITTLTGITNDMVGGKRIDDEAVSTFVADANIVIAHNSNFDRKFAERYWPEFEHKHWGCSATEIDWRTHGFEGSRLGYLLMGAGSFTPRTVPLTTAAPCLKFWLCRSPRRDDQRWVRYWMRTQENRPHLGGRCSLRSQG